jgi:hypothetical protein
MARDKRSRRLPDVERRLDTQGVLLVVTLSAVVILGLALFRKGVLTWDDLMADA